MTNIITKKVYIGKTSRSLDERIKEHVRDGRRKNYCNRPLYKAITKYGIKNFTAEILYQSDSDELLWKKEMEYIKKYQSYKPEYGYNIALGGKGKSLITVSKEEIIKYFLFEANIIKIFNSVGEAAKETGCSRRGIRDVLAHKNKTCYGYYWADYTENNCQS